MDELKVPKQRTPVEIVLQGGERRQLVVFLAEFASRHAGPERLSDLLNGAGDFIPALDVATDTMTFVSRTTLAAARVAPELEPGDDAATEAHEVEVVLADGTTLRGTVAYALPPERSRLLDYLNDAEPFIRLHEREYVALVNKRHVARVARVSAKRR